MKQRILFLLILLLFAPPAAAYAQTFFQRAAGAWEGRLEYLDYSRDKRVTLATTLTIEPAPDGSSAKFTYIYDDIGRVIKSAEDHRIDAAAKKYYVDKQEYTFEETAGGLVLYGRGQDGEREEPIRKTVSLAGDKLSILKETRTPFTFRNQFSFTRSAETTAPERVLTPQQMAADLAVLQKTLVAIHPGLYRYNTPEQVSRTFKTFAEKIKAPLSEGRFFAMVAEITATLKCGHTYLNPLNQPKSVRASIFGRRNYFPFYFRLVGDRMIVTRNLSLAKLSEGSEITAINGRPVSAIITALLPLVPADGVNTNGHRLNSLELTNIPETSYQPFDIYYPLLFPVTDGIFNIEAIDSKSNKAVKFQVPALTRAGRFARVGKLPTFDDGWRFEIKENSTAVLTIANSITWRLKNVDFKKFLATSFERLRRENIENLIVDMRGNGGGDMDVGYELARYLARKKLPKYTSSRRLVRNVSARPELLENLDTYSDELKNNLRNGLAVAKYKSASKGYFEILPDPSLTSYPEVAPYGNSLRGRVFIISDASNASAAFQFMEYAKENKLGTIIGQTTGGNRQGINGGNYFFLTLPGSKIEVDIPVYFQSPLGKQKDTGVAPDVMIEPSVEDIAAGMDTEMAYILKIIAE